MQFAKTNSNIFSVLESHEFSFVALPEENGVQFLDREPDPFQFVEDDLEIVHRLVERGKHVEQQCHNSDQFFEQSRERGEAREKARNRAAFAFEKRCQVLGSARQRIPRRLRLDQSQDIPHGGESGLHPSKQFRVLAQRLFDVDDAMFEGTLSKMMPLSKLGRDVLSKLMNPREQSFDLTEDELCFINQRIEPP